MTHTLKKVDHLFQQESSNVFPKTLKGSLHLEWKKCGKPNCKCNTGLLHGPYLARRWREMGKQCKAYVPMSHLTRTQRAIERYRAHHLPLSHIEKDMRDA